MKSSFTKKNDGVKNKIMIKKPLHFREIWWDIYNNSSLKCNGFFIIILFLTPSFFLVKDDFIYKDEVLES